MTDIQVSICASATRTPYWPAFFRQFSMNEVKHEFVFAGPVKPNYELPPNVTFMHVNPDPGPVYCLALAAEVCKGETVIPCADDVVYTPHALDYMYQRYKEENDYKCMVHARYGFGPDSDVTDENNELPIPGSPWRFAIGILYSRQFRKELGGYDRRYRGGASEGDLQIRALLNGGRYVYANNVYVQEDLKYIGFDALHPSRAWKRWNGYADNQFMMSQWYGKNGLRNIPTTPVQPISFTWTDSGVIMV